MSSKGRAPRNDQDFYPTPPWVIESLLDNVILPGGAWIEPCAGDGVIIKTARAIRQDIDWWAVELRPEAQSSLELALAPGNGSGTSGEPPGELLIGNFLQLELNGPDVNLQHEKFAVAITNPPYIIAEAVIRHARKMADFTVMLLRTNFLGSAGRADWLRQDMPDVYQLPHRPSFRADGATDSIEYAWMIWPPEVRSQGQVTILPLVDSHLRKRTTILPLKAIKP